MQLTAVADTQGERVRPVMEVLELFPDGVVELIKEHKLDDRIREVGETRTKR